MPAKRASTPASMAEQMKGKRYAKPDTDSSATVERPRRLLLSVDDALQVLNMTAPRFYREVKTGRIETLKDGRRRLVPYGALVAYVRMLCEEQGLSPEAYSLAG